MKLKALSQFTITKKSRYEKLPLADGTYLILAIGNFHGMSITDRDLFNANPISEPKEVLLVRRTGSLMTTTTMSISIRELESLASEGYMEEVTDEQE